MKIKNTSPKLKVLSKIKFLFVTLLIFLQTHCTIFKESNLDTNGDLANLLSILRFLNLTDAFYTQSTTYSMFRLTNPNGIPYANGELRFSVFNEADINGTEVSANGESGNIETHSISLDADGIGVLRFKERGYADVEVYSSLGAPEPVGRFRFRNYKGLSTDNFSILSQTGEINVGLLDLSNYPTPFQGFIEYKPLGVANGRTYSLFTSLVSDVSSTKRTLYIASTSDGINFERFIKIEGISVETTSSDFTVAKVSAPGFDGDQITFFLNVAKFDLVNNPQSQSNHYIRFSPNFSGPSVMVQTFNLPNNLQILSRESTVATESFPVLSFSGRWMVLGFDPSLVPQPNVPLLITLDGSSVVRLDLNPYFCLRTPDHTFSTYGVLNLNGTDYLQCATNAFPGVTISATSLRSGDFLQNDFTFSGAGNSINSFPYVVNNEFVGLVTVGATNFGYKFPSNTYTVASTVINRESAQIPNFTVGLTAGTPLIRSVLQSNGNLFYLLSDNPAFIASSNINLFRSSDNNASVNFLPNFAQTYGATWSAQKQMIAQNGNLYFHYNTTQAVNSPATATTISYLAAKAFENNSWANLPKLIKIKF